MRGILTSKGRITIPKQIREALGLRVGQRVLFQVRSSDGVLELVPQADDLFRLGTLRPRQRWAPLQGIERSVGGGALRSKRPSPFDGEGRRRSASERI